MLLRKQIMALMLCACLLSALTSCLYYPDNDGELAFDDTFYSTYSVEDYNLRHWEVNGWEDEVRVSPDEEPPIAIGISSVWAGSPKLIRAFSYSESGRRGLT